MSDTAPETAAEQPDQLTIEIAPPISFRGGSYSEMSLREPSVLEVYQAEQLLRGGVNVATLRQYQMALVSKVSGWPEAAVQMLPIRKLDQAGAYVLGFTKAGQATGAS